MKELDERENTEWWVVFTLLAPMTLTAGHRAHRQETGGLFLQKLKPSESKTPENDF